MTQDGRWMAEMAMLEAKRRTVPSVLHVLPHPGGGGETYVRALSTIEQYCFARTHLASSAAAGADLSIMRRAVAAQRAARRHDVLHVHGEVAAALCMPVLATRPSVVTLHGLHLLRRQRGLGRNAARANLRLILMSASRTICVSESELADVLAAVGRRAARRAIVIRNGVVVPDRLSSTERDAARATLGVAVTTVVGVVVGSLDEHKDPLSPARAAIALARSGADVTVLFAGDGPLRTQLETVAQEVPGAVRPLGFRRDVRQVLAAADFFVLPSKREGLSFALLEAMSLGLPAVVSDAPGNEEVVGESGVVVRFGTVAAYLEAFEDLRDRERRLVLGERARERVRQRFRASDMAAQTRAVYDAVVGERHARPPTEARWSRDAC